jgi:hypothetical protein
MTVELRDMSPNCAGGAGRLPAQRSLPSRAHSYPHFHSTIVATVSRHFH